MWREITACTGVLQVNVTGGTVYHVNRGIRPYGICRRSFDDGNHVQI